MSDFDTIGSVLRGGPDCLAALWEIESGKPRVWQAEEFEAIFRHQMAAPLCVELAGLDTTQARRVRSITDDAGLLLQSLRDLILHTAPPLELLHLIKDFAKRNRRSPKSDFPHEIAAALYYLSISAALVGHGERITRLGNLALSKGLTWATAQTWLDAPCKALIFEALKTLKNQSKPICAAAPPNAASQTSAKLAQTNLIKRER